jgi:uncharacterized protein YbjQ (UPF0145 family)
MALQTRAALEHRIPVVTTLDPPPGMEVEKLIGPVWGITVRSRSVVGQACAGLQIFFGGEITALTELAMQARREAMDRLESHAIQLGANCILCMRFDSGELMQNTNEIVAYGTAVKIRPIGS